MEVGGVVVFAELVALVEEVLPHEANVPDAPPDAHGGVREEDRVAQLSVREGTLADVADSVPDGGANGLVVELPGELVEDGGVAAEDEIGHVRDEKMGVVEGGAHERRVGGDVEERPDCPHGAGPPGTRRSVRQRVAPLGGIEDEILIDVRLKEDRLRREAQRFFQIAPSTTRRRSRATER